ncbi:MAG: multiple cyclophane-containing RiPP AmcA [Pseudonocardiaceae bacterium]
MLSFILTGSAKRDTPTCEDWGRKGGSHYKDGDFTKK